MSEPVPEDTPNPEVEKVRKRRRLEAEAAGLSLVEARMFADSDIDIGQLRQLIAGHCPKDLLAKVLL